ncbi:hypothetical protein HUJ05_006959 [Dendroctonus ponderosae]|nr:hypothetical protein HUJ05_006959 [Dendroctonus ponderosae]
MQWSFVLLITTCAISVLSSPAPPCSTNGAFFADDDCTKYWSCANGIAYEFSCPATLNFNPSSDVCDYAASAGCTGKGWDDPTEPYAFGTNRCFYSSSRHSFYCNFSCSSRYSSCNNFKSSSRCSFYSTF